MVGFDWFALFAYLLATVTIGGVAGVAAGIEWSRRAALRAVLYAGLGWLVLLGGLGGWGWLVLLGLGRVRVPIGFCCTGLGGWLLSGVVAVGVLAWRNRSLRRCWQFIPGRGWVRRDAVHGWNPPVYRWQFSLAGLFLTTTLVALLLGAGSMIYHEYVSPPFLVQKLAISPDGELVAACVCYGQEFHVWQRDADGRFLEIAGWEHPPDFGLRPYRLLVLRGNRLMYVDSRTYYTHPTIVWRDFESRQEVERFTPPAIVKSSVPVFSPDGKWLAFESWDGRICVWDLPGKKQVATFDPPNEVRGVEAVSRDGKTVALRCRGSLQLWDLPRGTLLHEFPLDDQGSGIMDEVHLSFDADRLALAHRPDFSSPTTISTWNLRSGKREAVIHDDMPVWNMALSPNGTKIATANPQGAIRLWDAATGTLQASCSPPSDRQVEMLELHFFPDGKSVLVGYSRDSPRLWRHAKISIRNTETLEEEVVLWRKDTRWQTVAMALAFAGWLAWAIGHHWLRRRRERCATEPGCGARSAETEQLA